MMINQDLLLIQVKDNMRLGDGGTEVGVFRYIGGSDGDKPRSLVNSSQKCISNIENISKSMSTSASTSSPG
jgi:hypothetical protein